MTNLKIAQNILKTCFWGNTNYTPEYILEKISNKNFARQIFSAIFQNSTFMSRDLSIIKREYVVEFIKEQEKKMPKFNQRYFRLRLDALINTYIDSSYELRDRKWTI
nr:hypothetical protein [Campylobacter sp.]